MQNGLSIAREIIHAHGGTISVQSQFGKGTQFKISMPSGSAAKNIY
jgi:two-component system sensor histidine kinase VicK